MNRGKCIRIQAAFYTRKIGFGDTTKSERASVQKKDVIVFRGRDMCVKCDVISVVRQDVALVTEGNLLSGLNK